MNASIHTPTNGIEKSLDFYKKLGFKTISEDPIMLTDGKAVRIYPLSKK